MYNKLGLFFLGLASLESGARKGNLHIQCAFEIYFPKSKHHQQVLAKFIKSQFPDKLSKKYKVLLKTLNGAQTFLGMIGYVTKDFGRAHYRLVSHNIDPTLLSRGREAHDSMKENVVNDKRVITQKNIFNESYKFIKRCLFPCIVPVHYAIMYMLQSGEYMPSSDFIANWKKMDFVDTSVLWQIVWEPTSTTINDVLRLFFNYNSLPNLRQVSY